MNEFLCWFPCRAQRALSESVQIATFELTRFDYSFIYSTALYNEYVSAFKILYRTDRLFFLFSPCVINSAPTGLFIFNAYVLIYFWHWSLYCMYLTWFFIISKFVLYFSHCANSVTVLILNLNNGGVVWGRDWYISGTLIFS